MSRLSSEHSERTAPDHGRKKHPPQRGRWKFRESVWPPYRDSLRVQSSVQTLSKPRPLRLKLPTEGLEPTHPCGYQILSLARLPIPPRRPIHYSLISSYLLNQQFSQIPLVLRLVLLLRHETHRNAKSREKSSNSHAELPSCLRLAQAKSAGLVAARLAILRAASRGPWQRAHSAPPHRARRRQPVLGALEHTDQGGSRLATLGVCCQTPPRQCPD